MATITVSTQDVRDADQFLTAYLKDKIPDADFSEGSVTRDFVVKAIAYIFAYLEKERRLTRNRQSLLTLSQLAADGEEDVDGAVEALLSNWFLTRKEGRPARLTATLHFSTNADVVISPSTRFFRTTSLVFKPDYTDVAVFPSSALKPTLAADGSVADYTVNINLVAASAGRDGNVPVGRFVGVDRFSPFFLYAENRTEGVDGKDRETTTELLARAPTAITVRNLVNARSIDTVLKEKFSNLSTLLVVGHGDPEMVRDLSDESVSGLRMHTGGYTDIYLNLNRTLVTEILTVGAPFSRPDGVTNILRDTSIDFTLLGVKPGHVLRITDGLTNAPQNYIVLNVRPNELEVHPRTPFPEIVSGVTYTVGTMSPAFNNILDNDQPTGETTDQLTRSGTVILAGRPHYRIRTVEVVDTVPVIIDERVNTGTAATLAANQYKVTTLVPGNAQSSKAVSELTVSDVYDGKQLKVTYETLVGYDVIDTFVNDRYERVLASNVQAKGYHPVYVYADIFYSVRTGQTVSADAVVQAAVSFIATFDPTEVIDVSALTENLRQAFPNISVIYPFSLRFDLIAPDGQVYKFTTTDVVSVFPSENNGATLTNGAALRSPIDNDDLDSLKAQLKELGITDRTLRYLSQATLVTATQR